jgi:hypothetical protein
MTHGNIHLMLFYTNIHTCISYRIIASHLFQTEKEGDEDRHLQQREHETFEGIAIMLLVQRFQLKCIHIPTSRVSLFI